MTEVQSDGRSTRSESPAEVLSAGLFLVIVGLIGTLLAVFGDYITALAGALAFAAVAVFVRPNPEARALRWLVMLFAATCSVGFAAQLAVRFL
jgi:hypothetical protein